MEDIGDCRFIVALVPLLRSILTTTWSLRLTDTDWLTQRLLHPYTCTPTKRKFSGKIWILCELAEITQRITVTQHRNRPFDQMRQHWTFSTIFTNYVLILFPIPLLLINFTRILTITYVSGAIYSDQILWRIAHSLLHGLLIHLRVLALVYYCHMYKYTVK